MTPPTPISHLSGRRVLLVEDLFLIRMDLQDMLEDRGATVTAAANVAEGLFALEVGSFDVALLDVHLPDGEVFPLAHRLCDRQIPIIFHSGRACLIDLKQLFPTAIALSKPATDNQIMSAVKSQLPALGPA